MKKLEIVKALNRMGLARTVQKFDLKLKVYEHKILLQYHNTKSDRQLPQVRETRGIVLERDTWNVISYPLPELFFHGQPGAPDIDWASATAQEKPDGSLIHLYWDDFKNEWFPATTGMAEGEGRTNHAKNSDETYAKLFWNTADQLEFNRDALDKEHTYIFEITSPINKNVIPYFDNSIKLITARRAKNLKEVPYVKLMDISEALNVPIVKTIEFDSLTPHNVWMWMEDQDWNVEGLVVIDKYFNRVKFENPKFSYVRDAYKDINKQKILKVIREKKIGNFVTVHPEKDSYMKLLERNYLWRITMLENLWEYMRERDMSSEDIDAVYDQNNVPFEYKELLARLFSGAYTTAGQAIYNLPDDDLYELIKPNTLIEYKN